MTTLCLLYESSAGFALFERVATDEVSLQDLAVQKSITDLDRFSKMVKLKGFIPFTSAESALENINAVTEGDVTELLGNFLELNMPEGARASLQLGVTDPALGKGIQEALGITCKCNDVVLELLRGCRLHFARFIKGLSAAEWAQSQLGLGHAFSRSRVKFNVHRADNMIIQSIALLDQTDKNLNTFAMRVREWYANHFPELGLLVKDNVTYCKCVQVIKNKNVLGEEQLDALTLVTEDEALSNQIINAAKKSMGSEISEIDLINIETFAKRCVSLAAFRKQNYDYLVAKMDTCAPNLRALLGEQIGARLIAHAGSLTNLAKCPASTVQILGAEKALFRALKTKGNTPKFGLLFHSTYIARAEKKKKGSVSRALANKTAMAARIDCFEDNPTSKYGEQFALQMEEKLEFFATGKAPRKNADVMASIAAGDAATPSSSSSSTPAETPVEATPAETNGSNKRKAMDISPDEDEAVDKKKKKKDKKSKKNKKKKTSE
jgi:nucleolar protein 56